MRVNKLGFKWLLTSALALTSCGEGKQGIAFRNQIRGDAGQLLGELIIPTGVEPIDEIEKFRSSNSLNEQMRDLILQNVCQSIPCHRSVPLLYSTPVANSQGQMLGEIQFFEGQEPADVVYTFGKRHNLSFDERRNLLESICTSLKVHCTRTAALVYSQQIVVESGESAGQLEIYDNEEPVDAIYSFLKSKDLPASYRSQLLPSVCESTSTCTRIEPIVLQQLVADADGNEIGTLAILEGQEPADVVAYFGRQYGLDTNARLNLVTNVCSANPELNCTRTRSIALSTNVMGSDGETPLGLLQIEDGQEAADAIYEFGKPHNMTTEERFSLLQGVCNTGQVSCTRAAGSIVTKPIRNDRSEMIGTLHILENQEPADAVQEFAVNHNLTREARDTLSSSLCEGPEKLESIECTRLRPLVISIPISGEDGKIVGNLDIEDGQEPVDAVAPFCKEHEYTKAQRQNLLEGACKASGIPCTRDVAVTYYRQVTNPRNASEVLGQLHVIEDQEPTDAIYDFALAHNMSRQDRRALLFSTCAQSKGNRFSKFNCTRAEPNLLSIPIMETAEKELGKLEIREGDEPVDNVYAFMEKHDLFQTEPLNTTLVQTVCNSTRVTCNRTTPRRILFTLQATYFGVSHSIRYVQPEEDWECTSHFGGQKCTHYVERLAVEYCEDNMPTWEGCNEMILSALRSSLDSYETNVWKGKDMYAKLGLVRLASSEEIDAAYNTLVLRYNNETEPKKYEKLQEAYKTLSDPEEKYFYDLPCMKFFGLCGKKKKDGSISISAD